MGLITYPNDRHETDSESIFFIGSAEQYCKINNRDINLSRAGNFAQVFDLDLGENKFEIDLDGEKFTRTIIAKTTDISCPIAFARPYRAFISANASSENILRTILVENKQVIIPLASKPDYKLDLLNPRQASLRLASMPVDLDWIFYAPGENSIQNIEYDSGDIKIDFVREVESVQVKWIVGALILDYELGEEVAAEKILSTSLSKSTLVCIDPGHGGSQTGALSPKGIAEKDLNLNLALKLADELNVLRIGNFLTREDDRDLSLQDRVATARKHEAGIFISLHHNALPDGRDPNQERGISVHYYHPESRDLAARLLEELESSLELPSAGLYRQNLHVLRENTESLGILVEMGYLIHPEESEIIAGHAFQIKAAKTIAKFLNQYLNTL